MSRQFNGTSDKIVCSIGGCNLTGAYSIAVLFRRNSTTNYHSLFTTLTSGGVPAVSLEVESNAAGNQLEAGKDDTTFTQNTTAFSSTTNWNLVVVTRSGASAMNAHFVVVGSAGATMTHEAFGATLAASASQASGSVNFSNYKSGSQDPFDGWLAVAAVWTGVELTNAQAQELNANLKTSDWWNNSAGHPNALWEFNGTVGAGISDLSGNGANQSSISGTTQDTGTNPPGWTYDGTGSGGAAATAPQPLRRRPRTRGLILR